MTSQAHLPVSDKVLSTCVEAFVQCKGLLLSGTQFLIRSLCGFPHYIIILLDKSLVNRLSTHLVYFLNHYNILNHLHLTPATR